MIMAAEKSISLLFVNQESSGWYWSRTTVAHLPYLAWTIEFDSYGSTSTQDKKDINAVRCVRGSFLTPSSLSRNGEIVTDNTTGLQWQDNSRAGNYTAYWTGAINYCENSLKLGGHNDWRLPNINELLSIVDYSTRYPAIDRSVFQNAGAYNKGYWTSTSNVDYTDAAWYVQLGKYGDTFYAYKSSFFHVLCVRDTDNYYIDPGWGDEVNPSIIMYLLN